MAEDLKRSVENLQSPVCGFCHAEMKWSRSLKIAEAPVKIAHFFQCPHCNRITETRSTVQATGAPAARPKLSRPADRFSCAA